MQARVLMLLLALLSFASLASVASAAGAAQDDAPARWSTQLDNDFFSGTHRDRDYSWGASATLAQEEGRTLQLGLIAMTPRDLARVDAAREDRPYASLLFVTRAKVRVHENARRASFTSLTIGAFGLNAAQTLQKTVHRVLGGEPPAGWERQISEGGEPTARVVRAEQWLLTDAAGPHVADLESKFTLSGSVGFLTEGSVALSARWGRIATPWTSHSPELADYAAAPVAPDLLARDSVRDFAPEFYVLAGVRLKARAYNAFLQGQFRHSDLRVPAAELEPLQLEVWAGFASRWSQLRVTYTLRAASKEISHGPAARTLLWGEIGIDKAF